MACKMLCILGLIFFGFSLVNARVFYVDEPPNRNVPISPARTSYGGYPMIYPNEQSEQASRDLDMSFSAGDPDVIPEDRGIVYPAKKVYLYSNPERPSFETKREYERPLTYYKVVEEPTRGRIVYDDQYPVFNRKITKINNNGPRKGEIVLELRVSANSNNNNNDGI